MYDLLLTSGHGGKDPGAVGSSYSEHKLVVKINEALAKAIKNKSYASVKVINEKNSGGQFLKNYPSARLWHSSHLNGATDKEANGSEIIIDNTSGSKSFLADILKVLEKNGIKNRGIKNNEQLYVLNYNEVLSKDANHILEWGFVTNDADVKILLDNLDKIVNDIADLYIEQYGWKKKNTSGGYEMKKLNADRYSNLEEIWEDETIRYGGMFRCRANKDLAIFTYDPKTKNLTKTDSVVPGGEGTSKSKHFTSDYAFKRKNSKGQTTTWHRITNTNPLSTTIRMVAIHDED